MSLRLSIEQARALGTEIKGNRGQIRRATAPQAVALQPDQSPSQTLLTELQQPIYGSRLHLNFRGAIPNRRFELDLALPDIKFGIEVDGWQYHGKHKESFLRDREKDWLAQLAGWQIVRVPHRRIMQYDPDLLPELKQLVAMRETTHSQSRQEEEAHDHNDFE